ncbi:MAG: hypothetical protein AAGA42_22370 [Actinomycetota bacterium]
MPNDHGPIPNDNSNNDNTPDPWGPPVIERVSVNHKRSRARRRAIRTGGILAGLVITGATVIADPFDMIRPAQSSDASPSAEPPPMYPPWALELRPLPNEEIERQPSVLDDLGPSDWVVGSGLVPYINEPHDQTTTTDREAGDDDAVTAADDDAEEHDGAPVDEHANTNDGDNADDTADDQPNSADDQPAHGDDDRQQPADENEPVVGTDEICSGIDHLAPGEIQSFITGTWVWTNSDAPTGRWVWIHEQPMHHCLQDDRPAAQPAAPVQASDVDLHNFVADYGAARAVSHTDWLLEMTHPAIRDLFGDAACSEVLGHSPWAVLGAEVAELGELSSWQFEYSVATVVFPAAISATVAHYLHDGGQANLPFTVPVNGSQPYLAFDCEHPLP